MPHKYLDSVALIIMAILVAAFVGLIALDAEVLYRFFL